ncbi:hypothetical protein [Peribacillus frigoritolerans]|uniref:hypothetical protein n=1 Tax=Peribacillus frigoritolerans TaxID=450367 RepID=UPI00381188EA
MLTDSYYSFEFKSKTDKNDVGGFYCGSHAAAHFLNLINRPALPIFNPLKSHSSTTISTNTSNNTDKQFKWDPTALELYNAINLLIICWNKPIYGQLAKFKNDLEKYYSNEPFVYRIQKVNDIIGKDIKKRTLTTMINELHRNNPDMKSFTFNKLNEVLARLNIKSNF